VIWVQTRCPARPSRRTRGSILPWTGGSQTTRFRPVRDRRNGTRKVRNIKCGPPEHVQNDRRSKFQPMKSKASRLTRAREGIYREGPKGPIHLLATQVLALRSRIWGPGRGPIRGPGVRIRGPGSRSGVSDLRI